MGAVNFNCKEYLGKHISQFDVALANEFPDRKGRSYKFENVKLSLYDNNIRNAFLLTNNDGIVTATNLYFPNILGDPFYHQMVKEHGSPFKAVGPDKLLEEESIHDDGGGSVSSKTYSTKEVSISDKPIAIFWVTNDLEINMIFNYIQKKTKLLIKTVE